MTPRFPLGDLVALSVVSMTGAALMAWAQMSAFHAAYGFVCGSQAGLLAHCPACYVPVALLASGLSSLAHAASARRRVLRVRT